MKKLTLILLALCFMFSCGQKEKDNDCLTLSVDLNQSPLQYDDVFSNAEVIPLETTDSSLIVYPFETIEHKGKLYIYDLHLSKAFVFDEKGKFIRQIGRTGQGPGEYSWLQSISMDKKNDVLHLIEPIGKFHDFTLDGKLIATRKYPDGSAYHNMYHLGDYIVLWSPPADSDEDCISIIKPQTMEIVNTYEKGPEILEAGWFYPYNEDLYFFKKHENLVHKVTKDSLSLAFQWDFGKDNLKMYDLGLTYKDENYQAENDLYWKYMKDGTIPYLIVRQAQNNNYYYACLRHQYKYDKSVFYRKSDGKYLIFGEKSWNRPTNALVFTDDYMIILLNRDNYDNFKPILPESEHKKLEAMTEDDNPCLLKLYFKK